MAKTNCSVNIPAISSAFISKEGNEILSSIKASRYVDYINFLFGNVFKREYLNNDSFVTLSDFTDANNKLTLSGSLNNLYRMVEKELDYQLKSENKLTLPKSTEEELLKILENWDLFKNFHSKYNAYISIKPEDLEEKEVIIYDKAGNEHTEFQLLTSEVRTAFKFLSQMERVKDTEGNLISVPIINPIDGLPIRADFENIFKLTLDALKGIKDEPKFIQVLTSEELLNRVPELYSLLELFPVSNENGTLALNNKQRLLFHKFFQVMSRDYIPVYASDVKLEKGKLPVHRRFKSARGNVEKIEKQFISNFISNQEENEYVKIDNSIDEENPVYGRKRLFSLPNKLPLIDLSSDQISKISIRKIKNDYKDYFDFLKLLGIEFSDFSLIPNKRVLIDILNSTRTIHDNLSERLKRGIKIFNPIENVKDQVSYIEDTKTKKIKSIRDTIRSILKFEGTISKISPTLVTKTASGESKSDITYSNAISIATQQINEATSLEDLYTKPYFLKLKYNPLHKNSYVGSRIIGNKNFEYILEDYSGHTIIQDDDSISSDTKDLLPIDKFVSDFSNLLGWGTINTPQLESKAGYFAIKFIDKSTDRPILPFPENQFTNDFITNSDFTGQILNYLYGEIERVKSYPKVKAYAPKAYGEFHIFKNMISKENEKNILKDKNSVDYKKAEQEVLLNMNKYFNKELKILNNYIKVNNIENFISQKVLYEANINQELFKSYQKEYTNSLLRTFIANDFVHNVEFGIYISGDPLFYKDYHKRLGGLSSTGTQPIATSNIQQYFNSDSEKLYWDNFSLRGILNQFVSDKKKVERRNNSDTFLSAVMQEDNVKQGTEYQKPETIENFIYSVKLNTGKDITPQQARNALKIDKIETDGIDIGDGEGYLNLDAARELSIEQGTYRPQQDVSYKFEALVFKQMLLEDMNQQLDEEDTKLLDKLEGQIFRNPDKYGLPTLKQTYYGTLSNENIQIDAKVYDKFSLAIILPSTAKNHPKLKKMLLAMAKRQISYVKYKSGTKGFVRDQFKDADDLANEKNELDELQTSLLKLQITPPKTEKPAVRILTQQVKLLFTNLFDEGNASESVINLRNKFLSDLNNIKEVNRKNILKRLGFETDDKGKITSWNKEKIIDALVTQVNLQKLPTPILEALETNDKGDFVNTIESSNVYQQLLNYVTGKLDSNLREFKINGGDFVLISESMFETPLRYTRLSKDKSIIKNMDARVTMTKEFTKLLNLPDFENPNKKIDSIIRMNQLLKIPAFREKYKNELTIVFARAPVQGLNSQGAATIVEFFYPTAGNNLQLPKEFMHQSGIDFDYDKERVLIPALSNDGVYISNVNLSNKIKELEQEHRELREIYDAYEEEKEESQIEEDEIEDYSDYIDFKNKFTNNASNMEFLAKIFNIDLSEIPNKLYELDSKIEEYFFLRIQERGILSNNLLQTIKESLQQPQAYSELILPNTDETVRPLAIENGKDIGISNALPSGIDVYSYFQNLEVFRIFNNAKAMLAPFALHNVFMELIAPLNITLNLDYNINEKGIPSRRVNRLLLPSTDRTINISKRDDINGNNKQHVTSEFINATVDSTKDPYVANFLLSFNNMNVHTFLQTIHYPIDLVEDFLSTAVVRKYVSLRDKGLQRDQAVKQVISQISSNPSKDAITLEQIFIVDQSTLGKDNSDLISRLKQLKTDESLDDKSNYKYHRALLANFVAMDEHSKPFSNFKNLFKNDTNKTSSLYEISSKESLRNTVINAGMFSNEDVVKVENSSTMTAFRNDDLIGEVLKTVFPIMSNPTVYHGLGDLFNDSKQTLNKVDKRILSQVIINDYITTLLFSFGKYKDSNFFLYGKDLITKTKKADGKLNITLLERFYKFRQNKEYPNLIKQFPVLTKILGEVSTDIIKGNPIYNRQHGFNVFLNIDPNIPIFEKESFMTQFKQIIEKDFTTESSNPMVKAALVNLVKDFFIAGIIQSGFNKTNISFLEYAPVKFVQSLLNPALHWYNEGQKDDSFLKDYVKYFSNNLFKFNNSRYFYIRTQERPRIIRNTHLGKYLYIPDIIDFQDSNTKNEDNPTDGNILKPYPGVENIPDSGLTTEQANQFINLLQPQITNQAYVENKAYTANRMFSFGLRWAKNIPNETEKSKQRAKGIEPRPDRVKIQSKNAYTYGYYRTDQNNNPIPPISELQPIIDFIQSKLGIDMSNYDSVLANIYEEGSFIHQHRDITESITAEKYPVIVINLGAKGGLLYDSRLSNQDISSTDAYAKFKADSVLPIKNGGIYAFGVDGINRFTFSHRVEEKTANTPTKPIVVPIWDNEGNKTGEKTLTNYRVTLTFRRAQDLTKGMPTQPNRVELAKNQPTNPTDNQSTINKKEQYTKERYDNALGTAKTFMSNFEQLENPIKDEFGNEYWNSEGYYMAQRANNQEEKKKIAEASKQGGQASRNARKSFNLEQDENKRYKYMINAVRAKFTNNPNLAKQLLDTGNQEIIEKNYWKDDLFGVRDDTLQGANILGKVLMQVRNELSNTKYNAIPITETFTRESVKKDSNYIYLFTDNAQRTSGSNKIEPNWYTDKYGITGNYPTMTQAIIRGLENAFPITTMIDDKKTQWTDDKFEEYKAIIDSEINEIKDSIADGDFKGIKYSANTQFGKGKISNMKETAPKIWDYLNQKLKEIGIDNTDKLSNTKEEINTNIIVQTQLNIEERYYDDEYGKRTIKERNVGNINLREDIWHEYKKKIGKGMSSTYGIPIKTSVTQSVMNNKINKGFEKQFIIFENGEEKTIFSRIGAGKLEGSDKEYMNMVLENQNINSLLGKNLIENSNITPQPNNQDLDDIGFKKTCE